ncbi:MAG: hypothetical protein ACPMAQ_11825 [Phycisphaerae bacterium]
MSVRCAFLGGLAAGVAGALAVAVWAADQLQKQERASASIVKDAQHERDRAKDKEEAVPTDEIPAKVREALARRAGGARIARYTYQREEGFETYGAEWTVAGRRAAALVTCEGHLIQHDEEMAAKDVPPGVRKAVARMFPEARDVVFEKWTTVEYDVRAVVKGEEREAVFSPTGEVLETDEDDGQDGQKPEDNRQEKGRPGE